MDILAVVTVVAPRLASRVIHDDIIKHNALHRYRCIRYQDTSALLWAIDRNVAESYVSVLRVSWSIAMRVWNGWPAYATRSSVCAAQLREGASVALLRRTDPNCPLFRFIHHNVLVGDVSDKTTTPELQIYALESVMHVGVSESYIAHG